MSGWGQRLAICIILLPLSDTVHLAHETIQPHLRHLQHATPLSWASFMSVWLPFFPSPFLPSLLHHIPDCTTRWQLTLLVLPHPSICWQALWPSREEQQGGTAVTLGKVRCFSGPQFLPCKRQVLFTASIKHFKVFWWMRPRNTQASQLIRSQPPWRAFSASRPHQGSPLSPERILLFAKQLSYYLTAAVSLSESSPERRYWSNADCFV